MADEEGSCLWTKIITKNNLCLWKARLARFRGSNVSIDRVVVSHGGAIAATALVAITPMNRKAQEE
ncbi:MAG TPA: hypothetical protein VIW64_17255, partial [Pyrinomonadaceae bacterium]